jgi:hypothetical protein
VTTYSLNARQAAPRGRRRVSLLAVLAICAGGAGLAAGCRTRRPHLLTFADLETLAAPMDPTATFAKDDVPGGLHVRDYLSYDGTNYHLTLRNTWTESYRSAYVTAEVWTGFDEIWVQPVYLAVTGFTDGKPDLLPDPGISDPAKSWSPVFSVGPDSAFYSPFWQTFYFQVPKGTDPDEFTSARKVIDSGLPLIPGPGHTMSIVPGDNVAPATSGSPTQMVGGPQGTSSGYLDGKDVDFLDFGEGNFAWGDDLVVAPTPLFMLVYRDADGSLKRLNVPTVAGTGPLYANRPNAVSPDGVPHYGALWRLFTVEVPATARIFAPPLPELATAIADYPPAFVATDYGPSVIAAGASGADHWLGRVALDAADCFSDVNNLGSCEWLDSQPAVERAVPASSIQATDVLVTCPFVSYQDQPVVVAP